MENSFEFQRRQLWIDLYKYYIQAGMWSSDQCVQLVEYALAEFDKRFPQPEQSGMMDEKEFKEKIHNKYSDKIESYTSFYHGAFEAYKLLTGKE